MGRAESTESRHWNSLASASISVKEENSDRKITKLDFFPEINKPFDEPGIVDTLMSISKNLSDAQPEALGLPTPILNEAPRLGRAPERQFLPRKTTYVDLLASAGVTKRPTYQKKEQEMRIETGNPLTEKEPLGET